MKLLIVTSLKEFKKDVAFMEFKKFKEKIKDIKPEELSHYFVEMRERLNQCKFNNCRHVNEPGCAVIKAVEEGEIEISRYESYLSIFHNHDTRA